MTADTTSFVTADDTLAELGLCDAIQRHDSAALFNWLVEVLSYQGVSNEVATSYLDEHGCVSASEIERGFAPPTLCPKLASYWHFSRCGYRKTLQHCSEPAHFERCPVPRHDLRNGGLNQSAYSLFLFFRDVAADDFVGWLDRRLADADRLTGPRRPEALAAAVIEPMTNIHGVSYKVLNMSLSNLLLFGDPNRERWRTAGSAMIAIDTLVHNWLHRTGILAGMRASHGYGPRCYRPDGCASIIRRIAAQIDARNFDPAYPKQFPRFVQFCLWWFCAQDGFNQCNGNRIDDGRRCRQRDCPLSEQCRRMPLRPPKPKPVLPLD